MQDRSGIEDLLADIKARHSGKMASFGPLEDLTDLYGSLTGEERRCLLQLLRDRATDPFWAPFIEAVLRKIQTG